MKKDELRKVTVVATRKKKFVLDGWHEMVLAGNFSYFSKVTGKAYEYVFPQEDILYVHRTKLSVKQVEWINI